MKRIYKLTEDLVTYQLLMNGIVYKVYDKENYSRQEAESKAEEEVEWAIKEYGYKNVLYVTDYAEINN